MTTDQGGRPVTSSGSAATPRPHGIGGLAPRPNDGEGGAGRRFPPGFVWGAATAAYQIEGGTTADGRSPSIWDTFAAAGGTLGGDDGSRAAEHRWRMREDVALMAELGIAAYRFSVAWPRVQPHGRGPASQEGLDFYRALVDELLGHGIEPVVTLYHWDLPQALEDEGGWPVRATAQRFADYATLVAGALGDRVRRWTTVNEPWCAAMLGYAGGIHAPGRADPGAAVAAGHHLLLAHGLAMDVLRGLVTATGGSREAGGTGGDGGTGEDGGPEIGITLNPYAVVAAGDRPEDHDAARRIDGLANRLWYDPVLRGRYPDDVLDDLAAVSDLSHIHDGDLAQISRPIDALGLNYYRRYHVRHVPGASAPPSEWPGTLDVELVDPAGHNAAGHAGSSPDPRAGALPRAGAGAGDGRAGSEVPPITTATTNGWPVEPGGLYEVLVRVTTDYDPPPLYVHENGAAYPDRLDAAGRVDDRDRIAYLDAHLRAAHDALAAGVDLRGYFVWSLLDNFEWARGYADRFGIVHVDFATQRRTPKASAHWYGAVARTNTLPPPGPPPRHDGHPPPP
jgi:beta-glucosidase